MGCIDIFFILWTILLFIWWRGGALCGEEGGIGGI